MIEAMTLSELAKKTNGRLIGADVAFSEISTDTRTLAKGALYLALKGERFNGNEFVGQAEKKGAGAAVTSEAVTSNLSVLQVADTHDALGELARCNRESSRAKVIALTGSQGKTTVKEMLGAILTQRAETLITEANLNNTIGVPLTLLKINQRHQFAVVEMGASAAGEIAYSAAVTQPDIALITNASAAHLDGFGSLAGIVSAKGEIITGLRDGGCLLLNADDDNVNEWIRLAGDKPTKLFSVKESPDADYVASNIEVQAEGKVCFTLNSPVGDRAIKMNLLGKHNVANALAAAAVALEAGANLDNVEAGLAKLLTVPGRLHLQPGVKGSRIIDDSYNASPSSFFAAIDTLMSFPGRKILLMGDMKELGSESDASHIAVGKFAASAPVDELWAIAGQSRLAVKAYGANGKLFSSHEELIKACIEAADVNTVFLIKGSRGAKMNVVVDALRMDEDS